VVRVGDSGPPAAVLPRSTAVALRRALRQEAAEPLARQALAEQALHGSRLGGPRRVPAGQGARRKATQRVVGQRHPHGAVDHPRERTAGRDHRYQPGGGEGDPSKGGAARQGRHLARLRPARGATRCEPRDRPHHRPPLPQPRAQGLQRLPLPGRAESHGGVQARAPRHQLGARNYQGARCEDPRRLSRRSDAPDVLRRHGRVVGAPP
jgi:hypothetical protein